MSLKEIFVKPINRPIEGVIKADDDQSLRLELDEYVVTNEIEGRLDVFLDAYNNYENANGVWISGFFGSGKSHLLKMTALLLENRQLNDISILESFLQKANDNEILKVPNHLKFNSNFYKNPHDFGGYVKQNYLTKTIQLFQSKAIGFEKKLLEWVEKLKTIKGY